MFGFVADILTSVTSILFPIFASYKALRSSDPAQLAPWLMYWTTLSLFLAAESIFYPIISWLPFYSWIRFAGHLYLVLPGKQGSVFIYQSYIHPFLEEHEREIDAFISDSHEKAKSAGLQYLKQAVEWARVNLLGLQPRRPTPPPSRQVSYSQALLNRFAMPAAREGFAPAGANDLFSLLGNAMSQATYPTSRSRDAQAGDLSASGTLVPPHMSGEERLSYISTQRDRLRTLLQAFDNEVSRPDDDNDNDNATAASGSPPHSAGLGDFPSIRKSRSETEFEDLGFEEVRPPPKRSPGPGGAHPVRSASWAKWVWGNYGEKDSVAASGASDKKEQ